MYEDVLYDAMFRRRSVRKYSGPLEPDMMDKVRNFAHSLTPLRSEIRTELRFLDNEEVKGLFKVDAPHFLALYSEPADGSAANAGFMLQQMDLFLSANGIGSCWQGGSRPVAMGQGEKRADFISLAFGMPAEQVHRRDVNEFKRKALGEVTSLEGMEKLLEPGRLAPSAMNKQSWYFTSSENVVRVHHARSSLLNRMNRINAGIALCHIWLAALHEMGGAELVIEEDGDGGSPKGFSYVASVRTK
jgi:nitroreductase